MMHVDAQSVTFPGHAAIRRRALITLLFAVLIIAILLVLGPTTRSMIDTWQQSSTYSHCWLVIPIAVWMAWRQTAALPFMPLKPFWPGLALVAAIGFAWLVGELASAAVVAQFAAVGMAVAAMLTVVGRAWARRLAFPLGFLFFAVPFGEGLLPVLMEWTADVTVAALRASGIPVYREDNYFVIPSGHWSIIEACGGVRFLIAALMTGCIFAWLQYRSPVKRIVFVLLALAAALFANWLRAYAIVIMGHFSDNRIGSGADHHWWGWLIFGAAMFALFLVGMRWTDREEAATPPAALRGSAQPAIAHTIFSASAASLLMVAAWPAAATWIESHLDARPVHMEAIAPRGGWQATPVASGNWAPELAAPSALDVQSFQRDESVVSVYRGIYRGQKHGSELVSATNRIVEPDSTKWRLIESGALTVRLSGESTSIRTAVVRGTSGQFLIWHWYWLAGQNTGSDVRANVRLALQRLTGASDTAAWIAVYTPVGDDIDAGTRRLSAFVEAMSAPIDQALETTAGR